MPLGTSTSSWRVYQFHHRRGECAGILRVKLRHVNWFRCLFRTEIGLKDIYGFMRSGPLSIIIEP